MHWAIMPLVMHPQEQIESYPPQVNSQRIQRSKMGSFLHMKMILTLVLSLILMGKS